MLKWNLSSLFEFQIPLYLNILRGNFFNCIAPKSLFLCINLWEKLVLIYQLKFVFCLLRRMEQFSPYLIFELFHWSWPCLKYMSKNVFYGSKSTTFVYDLILGCESEVIINYYTECLQMWIKSAPYGVTCLRKKCYIL